MYDLLTRGFADFVRLQNVIEQAAISRDPLSGVLDGVNKVFHATYAPMLTSGSIGIYVNNTLVPGVANYDTGEITLVDAPPAQPQANYILTPYTANQIAQFTIQGFMEMEGLWSRGWQLLDGSGNWATENSANAFVVDSGGNDPNCGGVLFSQSRVQVALLIACCEYRYEKTQFRTAANSDFMWRESVRGMTVDKSKRPLNIKAVIDDLREELDRLLAQAQTQFYPGGENFGAFVPSPATLTYVGNYAWQSDAINNNNWAAAGFNIALRPLTCY